MFSHQTTQGCITASLFNCSLQIKRIARHRHVPKMVYKARKERKIMLESQRRKRDNVIQHSKPGSITVPSERKKHIVKVVE